MEMHASAGGFRDTALDSNLACRLKPFLFIASLETKTVAGS
jgi:hypothetical protein